MTACVFVGPTLPAYEIQKVTDYVCLPPAEQGDVYRAMARAPRAIGIIDGYFDGSPAVWHKEILFAMTRGVHVFGASSMGALRAAELSVFGMHGVGTIFEAYRDGTLEDDDEVALLHGPAEAGYVSLSVAMVDIRATLDRAIADAIVDPISAQAIAVRAKAMPYAQRTWEAVLDAAHEAGTQVGCALAAWLPTGKVSQKRLDAEAMITAMRDFLAVDPPPLVPDFRFEATEMWRTGVAAFEGRVAAAAGHGSDDPLVLDELRLRPDLHASTVVETALRLVARERRAGAATAEDRASSASLEAFRIERGLYTAVAFDDWLARNDLDRDSLGRLLADREDADRLARRVSGRQARAAIDTLKLSGGYEDLAARARRKSDLLGSRGLDEPSVADTGAFEAEIVEWYFIERLGIDPPRDIAGWIDRAGFQDHDDFFRAVLGEYLFETLGSRSSVDGV
jgi:hypothetical protein